MSEPYRTVDERCEILAVKVTDVGNTAAATVLYEAESRIRELQEAVAFWIEMYGKAVDTSDECAGDDEDGWDRQQHAEAMAAKLRAEHEEGAVKL